MKYVIGNWKMNTTVEEAVALAGRIDDRLRDQLPEYPEAPEVVMCAPFVSLSPIKDVLDGTLISLGAQNVHWADNGSHTGEISAPMLKPLADYVILGHSERRQAGEKDEEISRKLAAAVRHGLTPILCVGENDPNDIATDHVEQQLEAALEEVDPTRIPRLLVAYEPTWAIGGEATADPSQIAEVTAHLRRLLHSAGTKEFAIIYGASVNPDSVEQLLQIEGLDGFLPGRVSLDDKEFVSLIGKVAHG